ncbi:hypothetical protein CVIRNUC_008398 [Coccomyxa viridis]|uniref:protein-serine/threonine phosphatase n=1 Tax=Coccomyxa viridis TaxID=1274662 RepID=A0AAV1IDG1_9CHLO|nr:hypothetical protein CVIRNUC_008398 [Coccomyxa viridis]
MAQACCDLRDAEIEHDQEQEALQFPGLRHCIGTKRTRERRSVDLHVEDPAGEVNVACEAQPPRSEKHRARASFGGAASGLSDQSDTIRAGVQEMASPAPAADDSLPFDVASLRAAASAAVADCTQVGDGTADSGRRSASGSSRTNSLVGRARAVRKASQARPSADLADSLISAGSSRASEATASGEIRGPPPAKGLPREGGGSQHTGQTCPPHGAKAICGRRPRMEDAYTAIPFLLEVLVPSDVLGQHDILPPRIATQVKSASDSPASSISDGNDGHPEAQPDSKATADQVSSSSALPASQQPADAQKGHYVETLHFFGVFDGHGGAEGALHCAQTLHQRIVEAISAQTSPAHHREVREQLENSIISTAATEGDMLDTFEESKAAEESTGGGKNARLPEGTTHSTGKPGNDDSEGSESDTFLTSAMEEAESGKAEEGVPFSSEKFESALTDAFNRTDEEFGKADNAALVGTTAVVALVGSRQLYVANCGDSRAVLCRGGVAIPLTDDHKAAREDETARVEAAGGQILFWNGVRVMGVLAVSRAIGDHCLRPFVIAQPEVTILGRRPDDEILLLASDGLWDVLSNQEACTLAKRCLRRARQRGASRQSAARIAATVLTRAAVDRGSRDNVTVVVVDLASASAEAHALARAPSAAAAVGVDDSGDATLAAKPMARSRSSFQHGLQRQP